MTLMPLAVVNAIPRDVAVGNLKVLADFKEGDKPVTRKGKITKEDRYWLVGFRRGCEGAFDVKAISETFQQAVQILKNAETDQVFYPGGEKRYAQVKEIKQYAPLALQKLLILKKTYLGEKKEETADSLQKIYDQYLSTFSQQGIRSPSILKRRTFEMVAEQNGDGAVGGPKDFTSKTVTDAASIARSFWQRQEAGFGKESVKRPKAPTKDGVVRGVRFSSDPKVLPPPVIYVPLPKTTVEIPATQKTNVSPQMEKAAELLCKIASRSLDKAKEEKPKSPPPYVEKRTIRQVLRASQEGTSRDWGVIDQLRSLSTILPDKLRKVHEQFSERFVSLCCHRRVGEKNYNLSLVEKSRKYFKGKKSEGANAVSSTEGWEDEEPVQKSLTRSVSLAAINTIGNLGNSDLAAKRVGRSQSGQSSSQGAGQSKSTTLKRSFSLSGTDFMKNIQELEKSPEARRLCSLLKERRQRMVSDSDSEPDSVGKSMHSSWSSDSDVD